jgi:protein-tyrosine phosphatase
VRLILLTRNPLCRANLHFVSYPITDRNVPNNSAEFAKFVARLERSLRSGESLAVHCRAGIGRSGLLGACVLNAFGVDPDSAFAMLNRARGVTVLGTDAQVAWVHKYARDGF